MHQYNSPLLDYAERPLIGYLPDVLAVVREYRYLCLGEQAEIDALFRVYQSIMDDQYIMTATDNGLKRWEKMLRIIPSTDATLDDRRIAILAKLLSRLPYTWRRLLEILTDLLGVEGFAVDIDSDAYLLTCALINKPRNLVKIVADLLREIVPANIALQMRMMLVKPMEKALHVGGAIPATVITKPMSMLTGMNTNADIESRGLTNAELAALGIPNLALAYYGGI